MQIMAQGWNSVDASDRVAAVPLKSDFLDFDFCAYTRRESFRLIERLSHPDALREVEG